MSASCSDKVGIETGCPDCGAIVLTESVAEGYRLRCPRCNATLKNSVKNSINKTLAFSLSGLALFIPAFLLPVLELNILGLTGKCTMLKGVLQMFGNGFWWMSFLVLFCSVLVPLSVFMLLTFIAVSVKAGRYSGLLIKAMKGYRYLREWNMPDVYMLGILIAYIKLGDYGEVTACVGLYCFAAALLLGICTTLVFDPAEVWQKIGQGIDDVQEASSGDGKGLLCNVCGRLSYAATSGEPCPRCRSRLYDRKPKSVSRTWALTLTGAFLLIPANLCPITYIVYYGFGEPDTILTGIGCLIRDGMIPIAILVFIASIIVPILKLLVLGGLLSAIHFGWQMNTWQCTLLYRFISGIGRWSMLDLFMLSILVAMVEMGAVSSIVPGVGATAFATVVVITMLATMAFDPRMLWDMEEIR